MYNRAVLPMEIATHQLYGLYYDILCLTLLFFSPFFFLRYLLYIRDKGQIYLLDRDNSVFSAPSIKFFSRKRQGEHLRECLADAVSTLCNIVIVTLASNGHDHCMIYNHGQQSS